MTTNPIIMKECLQAARQVRTYAVRAALPLVAMMLLVPSLTYTMRYVGQDWRVVSRIARQVFDTTSWFMIFAFPLMAFGLCSTTLREEWSRRTMEVLCASPLTRTQIVYGKFVAALSRLTMCALALLPVMGLWFHMGRIPRDVVLGTFAVIVTSMLMMGAVALLQSAMYRPGKSAFWSATFLIVPYFLGWVMFKILGPRGHPLPDAALPPFALARVLRGSGIAGMSVGQFMALSAGLNLSVAAAALIATPMVFGRSFTRHLTAGKRHSRLRAFRRWMGGKRPDIARPVRREWLGVATYALLVTGVIGGIASQMPNHVDRVKYAPGIYVVAGIIALALFLAAWVYRRREADPFAWQEKGAPTTAERWAPWLIYGITLAIVLATSFAYHPRRTFDAFDEDEFYFFLFAEGLAVIGLVSLFYGTCVFAREKGRRRSSALLLTGHDGWRFYRSKIAALYWALRYPLVTVALFLGVAQLLNGFRHFGKREMAIFVFLIGQAIVFGPALCCVIGMAFSLAARNAMRACLGILGAVGWGFLIGWGLILLEQMTHDLDDLSFGVAVAFLIVSSVLTRAIRRWRPWKMALILALDFFTVVMALVACDEFASWRAQQNAMVAVGCAGTWLLCLRWLWVGLRLFDRGMAGEDV